MNKQELKEKKLLQEIEQLKKERDIAIQEIKKAIYSDNICSFCKNKIPCLEQKCNQYIEGRGMTFEKTGEYIDQKWSCMDFNFGTCPKLENTPCNGCIENNNNGFIWKGISEKEK